MSTSSRVNPILPVSAALISLFLVSLNTMVFSADREYYQVKIYRLKDDSQAKRTEKYLEHAFLPALHRAGIPEVGVFHPVEEADPGGNMLIVLIPFQSLDAYIQLPHQLAQDSLYLRAGKAYLEAGYEDPPYERIETILLKAFSEWPELTVPDFAVPPTERIYELRSYQSPTEKAYQIKLEMFNKEGEVALFKHLGFQPVFFGGVLSGPEMPNLMYMISFTDRASREAHWKAFRENPEWIRMNGLERYKNTVSHITSYLLQPADYSDL